MATDAARRRLLATIATAASVVALLAVAVLAWPGGTPATVTPAAPAATIGDPAAPDGVGLEPTAEASAVGSPTASAASRPATDPSGTAAATANPVAPADGPLAQVVTVDAVVAHLEQFAALAEANGGNRAAGLPGHVASVAYVRQELEDAGFAVELQPLEIPVFEQTGPTELEGDAVDDAWQDGTDFVALTYSPSGDVAGPVAGVDEDGCAGAHFAGATEGSVVVVPSGGCPSREKAANALEAGAVAVLIGTPLPGGDRAVRATLLRPDGITGPVIGVSDVVAEAVAEAGGELRVTTRTRVEEAPTANVVADSSAGDPGAVVLLGAHLDTVVDGPGINDNGSGTATILEIARHAATRDWPVRLRVAFWTGEELSLLGSSSYVRALSPDARAALRAYLNLDMVGSPNPVTFVYDQRVAPTGSEQLTAMLAGALDAAGHPWEATDLGFGSDHYPFVEAGVPIGGLYTGSSALKTEEQAVTFGGEAGAPLDACYHRACDVLSNVDPETLGITVPAAAAVVEQLLSGAAPLPR